VRKIALPRTPIFDNAPVWSPDGRTIAFEDIKLNLMKVDVASGRVTPVTGEPGGKTDAAASLTWSPDSRFLAFSRIQPNRMWAVFLHGMETGQTVQISDPLVDARYPAFDRGGRLLVFAAGTDTGLASSLQDMSAYYRPTSRALYGLVLDRDGAWPPATPAVTTGPIKLDLEGLSRRIVALPVPAANYVGVQAGPAGVLFLNEAPGTPVKPQAALFGPAALSRLDLASGKIEPLAKGVNSVTVGPNGETLSYRQRREWFTASTRGVFAPRKLDISATAITIDPRAEWTQMYREVWRSQRDQFYAPNHHGLDFAAAEKALRRLLAAAGRAGGPERPVPGSDGRAQRRTPGDRRRRHSRQRTIDRRSARGRLRRRERALAHRPYPGKRPLGAARHLAPQPVEPPGQGRRLSAGGRGKTGHDRHRDLQLFPGNGGQADVAPAWTQPRRDWRARGDGDADRR
jgi:tricorn protease